MEFKLPNLGEDIDEAHVIEVLVSQGDDVKEDQNLIAVETDKATLEVPTPTAGRISELHVKEGDTLHVGDLVATIDEGDAEADAVDEPTSEDKEDKTKAKESSEQDDEEQDTSKSAEDANSDSEANQDDQEAKEKSDDDETKDESEAEQADEQRDDESDSEDPTEGDKEKKEDKGQDRTEAEDEGKSSSESDEEAPTPITGGVPVFAAPSIRQLAREIGLDIGQVRGSGPDGRITVDDVKHHARQLNRQRRSDGPPAAQPLPDFTQWGDVETEDLSTIRKKTAAKMAATWATVPQVTLFEKADATKFEQSRKELAQRAEEQEIKLTLTAMLVKVIAGAVHAHPILATSIDMRNERLIRKQYVNIGVAVDTEEGLLVPVIRDAHRKNLLEISRNLSNLAQQARHGTISADAMQGGVITITNLGGLGTGFFTPIINTPQTAIVGVGRAVTEPVWNDEAETFEPRLMLPFSLAFDHRAMDGADAARALHWIAQAIEQPGLVALEG